MFRSGVVKAALAVLASVGLFFFAIDAALAQNSTALDPFAVNYFNNANSAGAGGPRTGPDDTLRIVDPDEYDAAPDACANIYVFDPTEEMVACCACPITPAGRLDFSVNNQLTNNILSGGVIHSGTIKVVKTNLNLAGLTCYFNPAQCTGSTVCDPTNGSDGANKFRFPGVNHVFTSAAGSSLLSFLTHDLNKFATNGTNVAEAVFQSYGPGIVPNPNTIGFADGDATVLENYCGFIQLTGRDHGLRGTCTCPTEGPGDL